MKFLWCTIHTADLARSLEFYTELVGLPVTRSMSGGPGPEIRFLGEGETMVELIAGPVVKTAGASGFSIGFLTDDLDAQMQRLAAAGYPVESGPFSPAPGIRFFYVQDPDGVRVQFVEEQQA